jgi:hypothetical protein
MKFSTISVSPLRKFILDAMVVQLATNHDGSFTYPKEANPVGEKRQQSVYTLFLTSSWLSLSSSFSFCRRSRNGSPMIGILMSWWKLVF